MSDPQFTGRIGRHTGTITEHHFARTPVESETFDVEVSATSPDLPIVFCGAPGHAHWHGQVSADRRTWWMDGARVPGLAFRVSGACMRRGGVLELSGEISHVPEGYRLRDDDLRALENVNV